jgi:asparagine synthase (glutamine-hydrolysing)
MLVVDQLNSMPFARILGRAFERWAPPGKIKRNGSMLGRPLESRYRHAVIFAAEEIQRLLPDQPRIEDPYRILSNTHRRCRELPTLSRMSYVDLNTWLPDDLLLKADRMSMAHSLEVRVPFLDHKLVEFGARLPADLKVRDGKTKYLLKKTMEPFLPAQILHRSKKGFSTPTRRWFRSDLAEFIREKLLASNGPCLSFFPRKEVARVIDAHKHRDCSDQLYALLVFDEWCRAFMWSHP